MNENNDISISEIEMQEIIRVPSDRIGVVIGVEGSTKRSIEILTETTLEINTDENYVLITPKKNIKDPTLIWRAKDMVKAIGRGFNQKIAFTLADPDINLRIISLEDGKNKKRLQRIRGRIIGENGKTRRIIEEITACNVSIYGNTVSIIGRYQDGELDVAQQAIEMLIKGLKHGTVYKFLEKFKMQKKIAGYKIWKVRDDVSFDKMWETFTKEMENEKNMENQNDTE